MMDGEGMEYAAIVLAVDNYAREDEKTFLDALESADAHVVWHGVKGCGLKRVHRAIPRIVEILAAPCEPLGETANTDLRRIAAWSLAQIGYDAYANYLTDIGSNPNPLLREGFADVLGMSSDDRALPILDQMMKDSDRNVILWGSLSLAKLGERCISVLERHLWDASDLPRAAYLADALKKIGTPKAGKILREYLERTPFRELRELFGN